MASQFLRIPYALFVTLLTITFTTIMVGMDSISVKFVMHLFLMEKILPLQLNLSVLTAHILLLQRKIVSTLSYINVQILSVPTTLIILKRLIKRILKTMERISTNSITSTVNSLWISLRWI